MTAICAFTKSGFDAKETAGIDVRYRRQGLVLVQLLMGRNYSGTTSPDPPSSAGKSFIFGSSSHAYPVKTDTRYI